MFSRKLFNTHVNNCKRLLLVDQKCYLYRRDNLKTRSYSDYNSLFNKYNDQRRSKYLLSCVLHRNCHSKGLDNIASVIQDNPQEKALNKIRELFSQPRATLNELATKTPDKIFDVYYKQVVVTPKGARKKTIQNTDWTCIYSFTWPQKMKFESTAISKRQAADKAATQALHWLYINRRIDNKGLPIYDRSVINQLKSSIEHPIQITISDNSIQRINKIWEQYESEIKSIYERTFEEAKVRSQETPAVLTKDSTIDDVDYLDGCEILDDVSHIDSNARMHPVFGKAITPPSNSTLARRDRVLREKFLNYDDGLTPLPIDEYSDQITNAIKNNSVTVVVGAAGCGKSTRAPAAILRQCGVNTAAIVSEPRRVAAIGLAQRVADELGEQVGDSIGYQVRLHSRPPRPPAGAILYCTSGILLRRLQLNPGLEGCTHVFIDEAHERDVNTDVTLLLLKRAMEINPQLKIVVMSATLDTQVFTKYFDECPVIEVPGRTFPVEVSYLGDIEKKFKISLPVTLENCTKEDGKPQINCQEVVELIKAIDTKQPGGAILVFLPGWAEIKLTKQMLDQHYGQSSMHMFLPVHSRLSTTEQTKMFSKPPPGVRKVVLATNIAETSITIPDVVYVVDTGAHKENRMMEGTGTASLETVWVSQAGAKQRCGRAGRVQPGICYRMYTKEKEDEFEPHTTPEILRIPLDRTVLDCKMYAPDGRIEDFLSQLPEPPSQKAIQFAVNDLMDLGALSKKEKLTRLGSLISNLMLPPRVGVGLLHSSVVGNLVAATNVATHCSDNVELFRSAGDRRDEIREIKRKYSSTSDHAALHFIQEDFERHLQEVGWDEVDRWCDTLGLRKDRLSYVKSISNLHLEHLLKSGVVEPDPDVQELNRFSDIEELTAAVLLSGSNSLLVTKKLVKTKGKLKTAIELFTSAGDRAHIGGESVNYGIKKSKHTQTNILTYFGGHHSTERRALVLYKTSLLSPHAALLFSMGHVTSNTVPDKEDITELCLPRHRLKVLVPTSQADYILKAREMLWNTFQYYIERDLRSVVYDDVTAVSRFKVRLMKSIARILVEADKDINSDSENIK